MPSREEWLRAAYDRATNAKEPLEKPDMPDKDPKKDRSESPYKSVAPDIAPDIKSDVPAKADFDRAHDNAPKPEKAPQRDTKQRPEDPVPHLRPTDPRLRMSVDRAAHMDKLSKEDREARDMSDSIKAEKDLQNDKKDIDLENGREDDKDDRD